MGRWLYHHHQSQERGRWLRCYVLLWSRCPNSSPAQLVSVNGTVLTNSLTKSGKKKIIKKHEALSLQFFFFNEVISI